ncbi:MAG TPA: glycosyltransferase family 2 protein [Glaciihabitans sp.]|jgi:GT2 family glycosyltransferase|nr:glycosyltransferase family 2 protein [Glaciihabitans sp.]
MVLDIMMPFYGRPDHFRLAVESVLAQTSDNFRLVIVDDGYPDPEPERWVASLNDPRITYIRNTTNLGVSGNFARCAELMTSEFGVIFGCDDVMLPGYVERVTQLLEQNPDVAMVQPGVGVIDSDGRRISPLADKVKAHYRGSATGTRVLGGEELAASLLRGNWAYFPSVVWRAETIQSIGFRLDLKVVQDVAMMMEIILAGGTMLVDDTEVFLYRRHTDSVSAKGGPDGSKFIEERELFWATAARMRSRGWTTAARAASKYVSSRLHAMSDLPSAVRSGNPRSSRIILSHILGLPYPKPRGASTP